MTQIASVSGKQPYVTIHGLPLLIELEWPFFRSRTGADFYILHSTVRLATDPALHALVALQLTLTLHELLPSAEPADVQWPVINALRKAVDSKEIEFLKSPKRIPIPFGSRTWDFKRNKWFFAPATNEQIGKFLERKLYWQAKLVGAEAGALIDGPADLQYLGASATTFEEVARELASRGLVSIEDKSLRATPALLAESERIEGDMKQTLEELERKHAFERG